jgi:hypothetical protein
MKSPPSFFVFEGVEELLHRWGPRAVGGPRRQAGRGGGDGWRDGEREEEAVRPRSQPATPG